MTQTGAPLDVSTQSVAGGMVVTLAGSATMDACDLLVERLTELTQNRPATIVFDLARLDFVCSMGLSALISTHMRAKEYGGSVRIASPMREVRRVLDVTKLSTVMPVYDTTEAALEA